MNDHQTKTICYSNNRGKKGGSHYDEYTRSYPQMGRDSL